jgi:hypothetical protein
VFTPGYRHPYLLIRVHLISVANVSVCVYPIPLLAAVYRYGYAMPFYNDQQTIRAIVFGTRNQSAHSLLYAPDSLTCSLSIHRSGAQFWGADRVDIRLVVHADRVPVGHAASGGSRTQCGN